MPLAPGALVTAAAAPSATIAGYSRAIAVAVPLPASTNQPFPLSPQARPDWPALTEAAQALASSVSPAASAALSMVPRPGPELTTTMLLFMAALGRGDISAWLGGALERPLKSAGKGELLGQLGKDFADLARFAADTRGAEWRGILIPVFDGRQVQQARLFVHQRDKDDASGHAPDDESTRFIFDLSLSNLGRIQVDGLTKPGRLDLVIRSQDRLPQEVRRDIAAIFSSLRDDGAFQGEIGFQKVATFAVDPLAASDLSAEPAYLV